MGISAVLWPLLIFLLWTPAAEAGTLMDVRSSGCFPRLRPAGQLLPLTGHLRPLAVVLRQVPSTSCTMWTVFLELHNMVTLCAAATWSCSHLFTPPITLTLVLLSSFLRPSFVYLFNRIFESISVSWNLWSPGEYRHLWI